MADKSLLELPLAVTAAGALVYGVQDNKDVAIPASVLQGSEQPQAANTVFAGPEAAPGGFPGFRKLVTADIPDLSSIYLSSNGGNIVDATLRNPTILGANISGSTAVYDDTKLTIRDQTDTTKRFQFEASTVPSGELLYYTVPGASTTLVGTDTQQTLSNKVVFTRASAASGAGFRIPQGVAPSSPQNGDVWTTNAGIFVHVNNSTVGPLAASAGSTVNTFNGRQGAVTLTSTDVTTAIGYTPAGLGANTYTGGQTANGTIKSTSGVLHAEGFAGVSGNGIVYLGDDDSWIWKQGNSFKFHRGAVGGVAELNSNGTIHTSENLDTARIMRQPGGEYLQHDADDIFGYTVGTIASPSANTPEGEWTQMLVNTSGASWGYQLAKPWFSERMCLRSRYNGTWQPWRWLAMDGFPASLSSIGPSDGNQGFQIEWNLLNPGYGANEYINNKGAGGGGHVFYTRPHPTDAPFSAFTITYSGAAIASGGFGPGSDPRLKQTDSLKDLDNAADIVYNLNIKKGKYISEYNPDGKERLFIMADEDMESAIPEVMLKDSVEMGGETYDGWSADQMIALLAKAVQELTDEVKSLKEKINEQSR